MNISRHITQSDKKKLYGLSAGQCNICKTNNTEILEIAHIVAHSPNGARGEYDFQRRDINSYDNLILLCSNCHTEVDKQPEKYSVEYLRNIKFNHEKEIKHKLSSQQNSDIKFLNLFFQHGNLISIPYFTELLPNSVNIDILDFTDAHDELSKNYAIYPLKDVNLQKHLDLLIADFHSLWSWIAGATDGWSHFSQVNGTAPIIYRLYDNLSYERNMEIDEHINTELNKFLQAHYNFIQYVRQHYPSVNILDEPEFGLKKM